MNTQSECQVEDLSLIGERCIICSYPCHGAISVFRDKKNYICDNDCCIVEYQDLKKKNLLSSFYKDKNK